jgi:hypothetical protein
VHRDWAMMMPSACSITGMLSIRATSRANSDRCSASRHASADCPLAGAPRSPPSRPQWPPAPAHFARTIAWPAGGPLLPVAGHFSSVRHAHHRTARQPNRAPSVSHHHQPCCAPALAIRPGLAVSCAGARAAAGCRLPGFAGCQIPPHCPAWLITLPADSALGPCGPRGQGRQLMRVP